MFWNLYVRVFCRPAWVSVHTVLLKLALHGLGVQNWWSPKASGEEWVLRQLRTRFNAPCVVDVGANVGMYSTMVRRLIPSAEIFALEPNPATYDVLAKAASEERFTAIHTAAGRSDGAVSLHFRRDQPTSPHASLFAEVAGRGEDATQVQVPLTSLDVLLANLGVQHVHLLKIDTEGAELGVLAGAATLINSGAVDWVQFEFNTMNIAARSFLGDFRSALPGYRFFSTSGLGSHGSG